ncbi:aminopeptidase [Lacticaseibacillus jixiensis]|uniref:aminopeptidase n=1 Tax=Lacticaseibacillus jixiensis TaxID=3231926 RepID=UPI0036F3E78F
MTLPNFAENLKKYAALAVHTGVGVQPGDTVYLQIDTEQRELAHLITAEAYAAGAAEVQLWWQDDTIARFDIAHMKESRLKHPSPDMAAKFKYWLKHHAKRITVTSGDPDNLAGLDPRRIADQQAGFRDAYAPLIDAISSNQISWTIIGAASKAWAKKVFPEALDPVDELWDAIFKTTRIYADDPAAAWRKHDELLRHKAAWLNEQQFDALHYTAPGTDLTVGLPEHHIWEGAGSFNPRGEEFMANMPTEEVFTAPDCRRIDGTVASTKPLSYAGTIIEGMHFTFMNGQVIRAHADRGDAVLQNLLMISGARSLGEVSLVPDPSPISQSGIIFYNTLFDENASDHMALGMAYPFSVEGGVAMTDTQRQQVGLNVADTHVDFMMGSAETDIDGIRADGSTVPIFRHGDWA